MAKQKVGRSVFFSEFLKKRKMVGSIAPSSRFLSRKMAAAIDPQKAKVIVELGPGDGCVTKEIIKRMGPETQLLIFELNEAFVEQFLQFDDPRIKVVCDSAEKIDHYLQEFDMDQPDYIISSLPLTNFPKSVKENILDESYRVLKPGGIYMQYQYMMTVAKLLKSRFRRVKVGFVTRNIPPAFVYTCYK